MTPIHVNMASQALTDASRNLLLAWSGHVVGGKSIPDSEFFSEAVRHIKQAALWLDLKVVDNPPPGEAHDRLLAARLAEGTAEAELYTGAPVFAGPDDGLQCDADGNVVGR